MFLKNFDFLNAWNTTLQIPCFFHSFSPGGKYLFVLRYGDVCKTNWLYFCTRHVAFLSNRMQIRIAFICVVAWKFIVAIYWLKYHRCTVVDGMSLKQADYEKNARCISHRFTRERNSVQILGEWLRSSNPNYSYRLINRNSPRWREIRRMCDRNNLLLSAVQANAMERV